MEFGEQIKQIRKNLNLTQEQFAEQLRVTRQAVSNWENDRNLPDIEMLIQISSKFHVTLDQLILGGTDRNKMAEKLIKDGSETRKAKMNMVSTMIGAALMAVGFTCFLIKALSYEYVDQAGILHEKFFLIPIGALFLLCGCTIIAVSGISFAVKWRRQSKTDRRNNPSS
jgi:transcriptional regulator with XRE-family HTH domain